MINTGLYIDESEERKANQNILDEFEKVFQIHEQFYDYMRTLRSIAGDETTITYKRKNSEEWLKWH